MNKKNARELWSEEEDMYIIVEWRTRMDETSEAKKRKKNG